MIGTEVEALTLSTVAVIYAVPVVIPEVSVVVAEPAAPVVKLTAPKVPWVVVKVITAPTTGIESTVYTSTRIVA